jgi:hypothetical protein
MPKVCPVVLDIARQRDRINPGIFFEYGRLVVPVQIVGRYLVPLVTGPKMIVKGGSIHVQPLMVRRNGTPGGRLASCGEQRIWPY